MNIMTGSATYCRICTFTLGTVIKVFVPVRIPTGYLSVHGFQMCFVKLRIVIIVPEVAFWASYI